MGYRLEPGARLQHEVRRVAAERLDGAIEQLDAVLGNDASDLEGVVHDVRKRCKASRGLARLAKPALGPDFRAFDRTVRDAARQLSALRDSHAIIGTFDALALARPDDGILLAVRSRQAASAAAAGADRAADLDDRLDAARSLLADARDRSQHWKLPRGFDAPEAGIAATYRQGRSALRRVRAGQTDHRLHEWRKTVKYLWYQMQLVHDAAPSVLGPLVDELDHLADALGDDHDLAVLVTLLDDAAIDGATADEIAHVRALARDQQATLRERAIRSGATIYAEPDHAFAHRVARYWNLAVDLGPEGATGGLAASEESARPTDRSLVERERKYLVTEVPDDLGDRAIVMRQGYLATGQPASVRVRDAGPDGCTLTIKAGNGGAERTELEWPIERREFEAAWQHTDGRRVEKMRHLIPFGEHVVELDVFGGDLDGLVIAEVEFDSGEAMVAFEPPDWFGRDVTDDGRYANASLALHGLPDA